MKRLLLLAGLLFAFIGCGGNSEAVTDECSLSEYRRLSTSLMDDLNEIITSTSISSASSRSEATDAVNTLMGRINTLKCRDEFPLKHETLEFTAVHFLEALDAAGSGDVVKAGQELDLAIINAERFNNWSVDIN